MQDPITVAPSHLFAVGEYCAAGLAELPDAPPVLRYARAYRRWLEAASVGLYAGGPLFPSGRLPWQGTAALEPDYSYTFRWNQSVCEQRLRGADDTMRCALETARTLYETERAKVPLIDGPHTVGGNGYTHGIVNYGRVLREGLDSYAGRIARGAARAESGETDRGAFYAATADLLEGIRAWCDRLCSAVRAAAVTDPWQQRLVAALERVPFAPARSLYETMVAYNLLYYLDGCDNPGRLDQELWPYYAGAREQDRRRAQELLEGFFDNVSANGGWSAAIGGSRADETSAYQELTALCLRASAGRYRPSLELRVRPDMPESLWEAAFDTLASGNGQPAFYNEKGYLESLARLFPDLPAEDRVRWNGGGCTETMLHGVSNVGSLDAGINLPLILAATLRRVLPLPGVTFQDVVDAFDADVRRAAEDVARQLNRYFAQRAAHRPQPIRSLLVDDCLDRGLDFNAGGARYNWSVVNIAGLANCADSLEALYQVAFREQYFSPATVLEALEADFHGHEDMRRRLSRCPKFGNDEDHVDALAAHLADVVYSAVLDAPCDRGRFLPAHIMFETFGWAGKAVAATPDGRRAGEPLGDSVGPVQGRDRRGPTAMLRSVARLPQAKAVGTPVLNLRLSKGTLLEPESRRAVRALIESYFAMGGMQVQISVLDKVELEDALAHPERHEDLIVRIGGYSAYFNRLSPELKQEVIRRTEYAV
jgi:formate C-acetyltransferase